MKLAEHAMGLLLSEEVNLNRYLGVQAGRTPMEGDMARLLGSAVTYTALLVLGSAALAHDWYPSYCCSEKDCRPLTEAKGESVLESTEGYELWDGRTIARSTAKLSPDGQFHLCENSAKRILCFFAPPGAS